MSESILDQIKRAKSELYESNDAVIAAQIAFDEARRLYDIAIEDRNLKATTLSIAVDRLCAEKPASVSHTVRRFSPVAYVE